MQPHFTCPENPNNILIVPTLQITHKYDKAIYTINKVESQLPANNQIDAKNLLNKVQDSHVTTDEDMPYYSGVDDGSRFFNNEQCMPVDTCMAHQITPSCSKYNGHRNLVHITEFSKDIVGKPGSSTMFTCNSDHSEEDLDQICSTDGKILPAVLINSHYNKEKTTHYEVQQNAENCASILVSQPSSSTNQLHDTYRDNINSFKALNKEQFIKNYKIQKIKQSNTKNDERCNSIETKLDIKSALKLKRGISDNEEYNPVKKSKLSHEDFKHGTLSQTSRQNSTFLQRYLAYQRFLRNQTKKESICTVVRKKLNGEKGTYTIDNEKKGKKRESTIKRREQPTSYILQNKSERKEKEYKSKTDRHEDQKKTKNESHKPLTRHLELNRNSKEYKKVESIKTRKETKEDISRNIKPKKKICRQVNNSKSKVQSYNKLRVREKINKDVKEKKSTKVGLLQNKVKSNENLTRYIDSKDIRSINGKKTKNEASNLAQKKELSKILNTDTNIKCNEQKKSRITKNVEQESIETETQSVNSQLHNIDVINARELKTNTVRTVDVSTKPSSRIFISKPIGEMDLRTVLTHKRNKNKFSGVSKRSKSGTQRENLVITVKQDVNSTPESLNVKQIKSKPKVKKSKNIKLVINVVCSNSTDSGDSDDSNDSGSESPQQDLSFLDDFNVDEIVDSLNVKSSTLESNINGHQHFGQTINNNKAINISQEESLKTKSEQKVKMKKEELREGVTKFSHKHYEHKIEISNKCRKAISEEKHTTYLQTSTAENRTAMVEDDVYEVIDITDDIGNNIILLEDDTMDLPSSNQQSNSEENLKMETSMTSNSKNLVQDEVISVDNEFKDILEPSDKRSDKITPVSSDMNTDQVLFEKNNENMKSIDDNTFMQIESMLSKITHTHEENVISNSSKKIKTSMETEITEERPQNLIPAATINDNTQKNKINKESLVKSECSNNSAIKTTRHSLKPPEKLKISEYNNNSLKQPEILKNTESLVRPANKYECSNNSAIKTNHNLSKPPEKLKNTETSVKSAANSEDKSEYSNNSAIKTNHLTQPPEKLKNTESLTKSDDKSDSVINTNRHSPKLPEKIKNTDILVKSNDKSECINNSAINTNRHSPKPPEKLNTTDAENIKDNKKATTNKQNDKIIEPVKVANNKQTHIVPDTVQNSVKQSDAKTELASPKADNIQTGKTEIPAKAGPSESVACKKAVSNVVQEKPGNNNRNKTVEETAVERETQIHPRFVPYVKCMEIRMMQYFNKQFTITGFLHKGYFSVIYKCKDTAGESYALKIISGTVRPTMWIDLQQTSRRDNYCLLEIINDFKFGKRWCLLTPYYPHTLAEALQRNERSFHIDLVKSLSRQLVSAVDMLNKHNIIHSDISPKHILLNHKNNRLKLCGFEGSNYSNLLRLSPKTGTANYRAPELILGFDADFRIDVWAVALIMYEMATGTQLFTGYYNNDILYQQLSTIGPLDYDMLQRCTLAHVHFIDMKFRRWVGKKKWVFVQFSTSDGTLHRELLASYYRDWQRDRTHWQVTKDLDKIETLHGLLEQMLVLNPRHRLPISFVGANEFIDYRSS